MPSRTHRTLMIALATLSLLSPVPAFAVPAPERVAAAADATWDTDRAAAAYAANPGAVTASGSENPGTTPGLAFDGDASTRWSSQFADDAWIRIDLGATLRIDRVVLDWEAAYGKRYVLEASRNGTDWTPFFTETSGSGARSPRTPTRRRSPAATYGCAASSGPPRMATHSTPSRSTAANRPRPRPPAPTSS
jgi:hypothetical protein